MAEQLVQKDKNKEKLVQLMNYFAALLSMSGTGQDPRVVAMRAVNAAIAIQRHGQGGDKKEAVMGGIKDGWV